MKLTDGKICEVWNNMPGGPDGWLKYFGFIQFARRLEEAIATEADAAIASRDAEIARLRGDAERYRWLRSKPFDWHIEHVSHGWATTYGSRELDAAIDAARKKG